MNKLDISDCGFGRAPPVWTTRDFYHPHPPSTASASHQTRRSGDSAPKTVQHMNAKGEKAIKRTTTILRASGMVMALAFPCWAQVKALPTQTVTIAGTVETIDQAKRVVNIKTADG